MTRRFSSVLSTGWLLLALATSCHEETVGGGNSETHFLRACDGACGGGLECLCGVCTRACDSTESCRDLGDAAECAGACSDVATGTCDQACVEDSDCAALGAIFRCDAGRCRADGGADPVNGCQGVPNETPAEPSLAELDPDQVALIAAIAGSCLADDGIGRYAAHIWEANISAPLFYMRLAWQAECLIASECGCDAVEHCLGVGISEAPEGCVAGCSGDVFTGCNPEFEVPEGYRYQIDCGRVGLLCDPVGGCSDRPTTACAADPIAQCNAQGEVDFCRSGIVQHGPLCADLGLDCGDASCVGRGAACTGESSLSPEHVVFTGLSCAGDVLEACVGGASTSLDCSTQGPGFTCQTVDGVSFCGLGAECVPAGHFAESPSSAASCSGTVVSFCSAGRRESIDCTSLGFTGCTVDRSVGLYGCTPGTVL